MKDKNLFWPWWMYRRNGVGRDKFGRAREVNWSWSDIGNLFKLGITFEAVDYSDISNQIDEEGYLSRNFIGKARAAGYYYSSSARYKK